MDVDLDLARIGEAARVVNPVFRNSPQFVSEQLCAVLGRNVLVKGPGRLLVGREPVGARHPDVRPSCQFREQSAEPA